MINRRPLYWGVFLVTAGVVMLAGQSSAIDGDFITRAARFWPLLLIGAGAGLLLRGTRISLAGGVLAAAMPGLLLGGLVVAGPHVVTDCGIDNQPSQTTRSGAFATGPARVDLEVDCGTVDVTTAPGSGWVATVGTDSDVFPTVKDSANDLAITSSHRYGGFSSQWGRSDLAVTLPTAAVLDLTAQVNAGRGQFDLAGAHLDRFTLEVNAASAWVRLPADADFRADLRVNAASLEVCAPDGLGLRVHQDANLASTSYAGSTSTPETWETPGYAGAIHHADVTVSVNVGSVAFNPEGGCK